MFACSRHLPLIAALLLLVAAASASQQDGAVAEVCPGICQMPNALTVCQVDQAAALRSALHLNVEVSGDGFHLANAQSLQHEGRVASRPASIFHFDPAREFGVGISHEAQRHVDEFLGALEHTNHMSAAWRCVCKLSFL